MRIIQICDRFQTLPYAGGLLDQDSLFMYILDKYLGWENERQELDEAKRRSQAPPVRS